MKKTIYLLFFLVTWNAAMTMTPSAEVTATVHEKRALTQQEADAMVSRLREIHTIAKGDLNKVQKEDLRNEVIAIKERLSDPLAGGIYISAGALILIVLILIILL